MYQFDTHFRVRFLAQYDSSAKRVLADLQASHEFLDRPPLANDSYLMINRGLFLKASYLWRF